MRSLSLSAPGLLLVAGSDPLCGAGGVSDAIVATHLGAAPIVVFSALVDQDSTAVRSVHPVPEAFFRAQLHHALQDARPRVTKAGMLVTPGLLASWAEACDAAAVPTRVVDPVLRAGVDDSPLARTALAGALADAAAPGWLLTPNAPELAALLGREGEPAQDAIALQVQAERLARQTGAWVFAKGGHLVRDLGTDVWVGPEGTVCLPPTVHAVADVHGTGCRLATALAAMLARGFAPEAPLLHRCRRWLAAQPVVRLGRGRPQFGLPQGLA